VLSDDDANSLKKQAEAMYAKGGGKK